MNQKYIIVVRDRICLFNSATDSTLKAYRCYYKTPVFSWDGTLASADAIIDKYQPQFDHMIDWLATFVPV